MSLFLEKRGLLVLGVPQLHIFRPTEHHLWLHELIRPGPGHDGDEVPLADEVGGSAIDDEGIRARWPLDDVGLQPGSRGDGGHHFVRQGVDDGNGFLAAVNPPGRLQPRSRAG